jgi:hypothetical protein
LGEGPVPQAKSTTTVDAGFQSTVGAAINAFTAFAERPVLKTEASYVAARWSKCAMFFFVMSDIFKLENTGCGNALAKRQRIAAVSKIFKR